MCWTTHIFLHCLIYKVHALPFDRSFSVTHSLHFVKNFFSFFSLGRSRAPAALLIYHPHPPFVNTFLHLFSSFFLTLNPVFFSFKTSYIMCLSSLALQQLNCFVRNTCFFSSLTLLYKHRFTKKFRRKFCEKNAKPLTEGVPYAD